MSGMKRILRAADMSNGWSSAVLQMDSNMNLDSEASLFFLLMLGHEPRACYVLGEDFPCNPYHLSLTRATVVELLSGLGLG